MKPNQIFRVLLPFALLTFGVWLLGRPGGLQPEGLTRLQALSNLSSGGSGVGVQGDVQVGRSVVHDPVSPVVVDFSDVVIDTDNADGMYARWQRGELDLDENDSIVSEAEMARLLDEALAQPPDDGVQIAESLDVEGARPDIAAPNPGVSFDAIDYTQSGGSVPPDPELAVGPNHMIAVVNVSVAIYSKTGTVLFGPTAAENLFSQVSCQEGLYDPNVLYDEEADRWIIAYDKGAFETDGGYCLLASQTGNPLGAYSEYFFNFNDGSVWLDFPHAGVGDNHIYMGGNMFTYGGAFSEGRIFAFDKSDLYAGAAVSAFERGLGAAGSTPQPLRLHGESTGTWPNHGNTHYFLTDPYDGATFALRQWNPVTGNLSLVGYPNLGGANQPIDVPQNGAGTMQANDWRPLDFEFRNGFGWTTMTVSCNPGGGVVNCIRWAQINLTTATLGPAGTGTFGSNGVYRFFPDLAVNDCDDMVVGYTRSSSSTFPSIWVTGRQVTDPNGVLQPEAQLKAGEIAYTAFDPSPRRWGDYTGMTIDPDGETFWYLGEYSKDTGTTNGRWGTYVGSFSFPDCGSPPPPLDYYNYLPVIMNPAPPPVTGPDPGYWVGGDAQFPDFMEFYVSPDRTSVEEFAIYISVDGCGNYRIWRTVPSAISGDAFSFSGSFYGSGSFDSITQASGTTGLSGLNIGGCGTVNGGPWGWDASWTNSSQPTLPATVVTPENVTTVNRPGIEVTRIND